MPPRVRARTTALPRRGTRARPRAGRRHRTAPGTRTVRRSAAGPAHRAVAPRRDVGDAAGARPLRRAAPARRARPLRGHADDPRCALAGAAGPRPPRAGAVPRLGGELPHDGHRRAARARARACDRVVPDHHDRSRVQRVDVHRTRGRFDGGGRRLGDRRGDRRAERPAARRRPEPCTGPARRGRRPRRARPRGPGAARSTR